ncbi:MAG: prepilin-type N-terminal cleavage/methylation domain-containing protein [Kangiellaceae bacterium]
MFQLNRQSAFTLMELIIVILLIGILSISFSKILTQSVSSYFDARDRNHHSQSAKWITESLSRSLREALPQSVRVASLGNIDCVEYMPIINATRYFNLPASGAVSSFNIVTFDVAFQANLSAAIMPVDATSLYVGTGVTSEIASITSSGAGESLVTLVNPTTFTRRSSQNRVYLLSSPVSFCLNDNTGIITKYTDYGTSSTQSTPPTGGSSSSLAENTWANGNAFEFQSGTLQRSALLQMSFVLQDRVRYPSGTSESVQVFHEVHIRNVP